MGSAGERAGLCEGDVVVEVNGQNVEEEYFDEVVRMIKEGGTPLSLLVMEGLGYEKPRNPRLTVSSWLSLCSNKVRLAHTHTFCNFRIILKM